MRPIAVFLGLTAVCLVGCGAGVTPVQVAQPISTPVAPTAPPPPSAPTPTPMDSWKTALANCKTQVVNVVVLADSRAIVDTTITPGAGGLSDTFGAKWPDLMRQNLQAQCGSHGTGLVPFVWGAGAHDLNHDFFTITGDWTGDVSIGPSQGGNVTASMMVYTQSPVAIAFTAGMAFDHLNAYCVSGPGLNSWTITVDGASVGTCGGGASTKTAVIGRSTAVPLGTHTAALVCTMQPCEAYGIEATAGTAGISVHNLAVAACTAECFGVSPATQLAFSDLIPGGHSLAVISLIANEPGVGYSTDSFAAALRAVVSQERSLPGAPSVLLFAPLQDEIAGQGPYYPVLANVAASDVTGYFDMRTAYGAAFVPALFGPDGIHENNAGQADVYTQVALATAP